MWEWFALEGSILEGPFRSLPFGRGSFTAELKGAYLGKVHLGGVQLEKSHFMKSASDLTSSTF